MAARAFRVERGTATGRVFAVVVLLVVAVLASLPL